MSLKLTKEQEEEVVKLTKKLLKCAGKQHPIILMNAAYMLMKAADATYVHGTNQ